MGFHSSNYLSPSGLKQGRCVFLHYWCMYTEVWTLGNSPKAQLHSFVFHVDAAQSSSSLLLHCCSRQCYSKAKICLSIFLAKLTWEDPNHFHVSKYEATAKTSCFFSLAQNQEVEGHTKLKSVQRQQRPSSYTSEVHSLTWSLSASRLFRGFSGPGLSTDTAHSLKCSAWIIQDKVLNMKLASSIYLTWFSLDRENYFPLFWSFKFTKQTQGLYSTVLIEPLALKLRNIFHRIPNDSLHIKCLFSE